MSPYHFETWSRTIVGARRIDHARQLARRPGSGRCRCSGMVVFVSGIDAAYDSSLGR